MLQSAKLEDALGAEAAHTAVYVLNRTVGRTLEGKTPYEACMGKKPTVAHLRVFGCDAYSLTPKRFRKKLALKSKKFTFLDIVQIWAPTDYGIKASVG